MSSFTARNYGKHHRPVSTGASPLSGLREIRVPLIGTNSVDGSIIFYFQKGRRRSFPSPCKIERRLKEMKFYMQLSVSCFLLSVSIFSARAQDFYVTEAVLKADVPKIQDRCPIKMAFSGYIKAKGTGTVKYTFVRSDGATSPVYTLDFKESGSKPVTTDWTLGDINVLSSYDGWQAIKILSPNELESNHAPGQFGIQCIEPPSAPEQLSQNEAEILCPVRLLQTEVTTALPTGWWQTPQRGTLQNISIIEFGGRPTLVCEYWAYGHNVGIMHQFPEGKSECRPNSQNNGFICR